MSISSTFKENIFEQRKGVNVFIQIAFCVAKCDLLLVVKT